MLDKALNRSNGVLPLRALPLKQEKYMLPRWPDMFDVSINVAVQIDRAGFHVAVDGKYCATFAHRT